MPHNLPGADPKRAGDALRRLVDLISHRSGLVFALMNDASVTLPQVVLLSRVQQFGSASLSDLVEGAHTSPAAVSQMIERLVRQGLLLRTEDPADRRRKAIALTPRGRAFLRKIEAARSADYALGLRSISPELLGQMTSLLDQVVAGIVDVRASKDVQPRREPETETMQ